MSNKISGGSVRFFENVSSSQRSQKVFVALTVAKLSEIGVLS